MDAEDSLKFLSTRIMKIEGTRIMNKTKLTYWLYVTIFVKIMMKQKIMRQMTYSLQKRS